MPPVDPASPPEEFDPEKTLFFKRRREGLPLLPLIVGGALILGSGVLLVWAVTHGDQTPRPEAFGAAEKLRQSAPPSLSPPPPRAAESSPPPPPAATPFDASKPVRAALPVDPAADGDAPPATPDPAAPLNLDLNDPDNAQVRAEVLRRIDLMPGVSPANKDKLYASVDHARAMGRLLTLPFVKGEAAVRPADVDRLKAQLAAPTMRQTLDDPTVVFVILGYADPKGSDKVNADVSLARARSVLDALRDRCGIQNVMHAVAMGGSTLFSARQAEKNRVVEIWAVLP